MADEQNNTRPQQTPDSAGSGALLSAFLKRVRANIEVIGVGLTILISLIVIGIQIGDVLTTLKLHGETIKSIQAAQSIQDKKFDRICYRLNIPCSPDAPYSQPHIDTSPGTATAAPPAPHSKLTPPGTMALKEKPAPISYNQPNY
jgi:hypothetical protein